LKKWAASAVCVALWAGVTALASAQAPAQGQGIYTCVDKYGRRLTADRPIIECLDREQRELSPSGVTRRQIGPSLSDSERALLEAQQRKDSEERVRVIEERRRERALVARYPDKAAHDVERNAAIQMVDEVTATAEKRMVELKNQRKAFDLEMEFYKKDPNKAPMTLRRKIAENEDSVAELQRFILGQEQEKRKVHQKFDVELAKLKGLWEALKPVATTPGAAATLPSASPASR
jgi:hypothetical protein